jgi:hypothetical protein
MVANASATAHQSRECERSPTNELSLRRRIVNGHQRRPSFGENCSLAELFGPFLMSRRVGHLPEGGPSDIIGLVYGPFWVCGSSRLDEIESSRCAGARAVCRWAGPDMARILTILPVGFQAHS